MDYNDIDTSKFLNDLNKLSADLEVQKKQIFEKMDSLKQWNLFKGISSVESSGDKSVSILFDNQEERDAFLEMFKK